MGGKQLYGRFKRLTREKWMWLRKGNPKKEEESLLIEAQNDNIRTNHIKARIDKMSLNSKHRFCGGREENINQIISQCSKLEQKEYKTKHGWGTG